MIPFNEFKGIEVSGRNVLGLVQAFGQFKSIASQILLAEGLGRKGSDGLVVVDTQSWYPFDAFLRAFARASQQMGDSVLHQIGVSVMKTVEWLPTIKDVKTMMEAMDASYHMQHRKNGRPMWDPTTGHIKEGIGHYKWKPRPDGSMEVESNNPYPCAFDKGLLFGGMRRLNATGSILHDEMSPCRKKGHASCIYIVRA
ncbi:hypothetical protein [Hyalangium rubrum]|uniref:4-vinyl reductase 4VR domain-containing protein n=1 Tax=Hyalangium rubrum TaxID=3103134 RepID=A0ABU5GXN7_9BACT|nr:hypothetical protein [Hyalangium sp. s54d21]MDY7225950.1 hypothetical protein [Hyalangium sp. s54d21]